MDFIPADFLKQFPYIVVLIGLFIWMWRVIVSERDKCDEHRAEQEVRMAKRDEYFTEVIDRNSRALADLDRTIANLRFRTTDDRRQG